MIINSLMHLEVVGDYWEGLEDQIIEHYDAAGIDKGIICATWMPSKKSNDLTQKVYNNYPDRFIPFGHIRIKDSDWKQEAIKMNF